MSAFGEMSVVEKTPQVQMKFPYGVNSRVGQTLTNHSSSTVTSTLGYAKVTCAGAYPAFSQIRTIDTLRYGPGQGAEFLGANAFITGGVALSSQVFGIGDDDEGFFFGYNGTAFGVLHRSQGSLEIKSLTLTSGAVTASGNITITLDGSAVVIAVAQNDTIAEVVAKIVAKTSEFGDAGRGWEVATCDNLTVKFISLVAETAGGAFSFVDTDTTGVAADAFATIVTGVVPTETWIPQADWNMDVMDGTGHSEMTLDPSKINVYKIQFQYLGGGMITYSIEDTVTGQFREVHQVRSANTLTEPTLINPTLHLTLITKTESGYSGGVIEMRTSSMAGFIEGKETTDGVRNAVSVEKSMTTTQQALLILHNDIDFNSLKNKVTVFPDFLTLSTEAAKPVEIRVIANPTEITGATALTAIDAADSVMSYSSAGSTVVGGSILAVFAIESGSPVELDFKAFHAHLQPGERWVFTGEVASGSAGLCKAGVSWLERI